MSSPAGWYPHETDEHRLRFWDGEHWTEQRVWDGSSWVDVVEDVAPEPPPFDMERVTLTIVDSDLEPIPPEQLVPPPGAAEDPADLPPPPGEHTEPPLPPPPVAPVPELDDEPVGAPTEAMPSLAETKVDTPVTPTSGRAPAGDEPLLPPPPSTPPPTVGVAPAGHELPPPPSSKGRSGRSRWFWIILAVLVVAALGAGAALYVYSSRVCCPLPPESAAVSGEVDDAVDAAAAEPTIDGSTDDVLAEMSTTTTTMTSTTTTTLATSSDAPIDEWVVVLASVETASGAAAIEERVAQLRTIAPGAQTLVSDEFASLRPGYTVVYLTGPTSGEGAVSECRRLGLEVPNGCYGRYLSQDPADQDRVAVR